MREALAATVSGRGSTPRFTESAHDDTTRSDMPETESRRVCEESIHAGSGRPARRPIAFA
jgi:hypothetical protein